MMGLLPNQFPSVQMCEKHFQAIPKKMKQDIGNKHALQASPGNLEALTFDSKPSSRAYLYL